MAEGEIIRETIVVGGIGSIHMKFQGGATRTTGTTVDGVDLTLDMVGDIVTVGPTQCTVLQSHVTQIVL